jgi:nucleoside phosphorylase
VLLGTLASADRDILPEDIPLLIDKYDAAVADWESGAIAWVAQKNGVHCMILRAVSDLVDADAGEAYGNYSFFEAQCQSIMAGFARDLPEWLDAFAAAG